MKGGLRITNSCLYKTALLRKGAKSRQAQYFLMYILKCFCHVSFSAIHGINTCCFGLYKKSVREVKQMLSKQTINTENYLVLSTPDNSKRAWKTLVFGFIIHIYTILPPFKLSPQYISTKSQCSGVLQWGCVSLLSKRECERSHI